jgi:hypothetical protein
MSINHTSSDQPPWQDPPLNFFTRVIGFIGILCLAGLILWSAWVLTVDLAQGNLSSPAHPSVGYILLHGVVPVAGIVAGITGWRMIRRYVFKPLDFQPPYPIPARTLGTSFTIFMDWPVDGWGTLLFAPEGLKLRAKASGFEAVNVLDIIRSIIFQLARYVVKKLLRTYEANYIIAYSQVTGIKVTGRSVILYSPDGKIKKTKFRVSSADGERLYRELNAHFPGAIEEWRHLLVHRN